MDTTSERRIQLLAKFFHGFADYSRLSILFALRSGPLSVGNIVEATGFSQSNVSNHLACLKNCGHVKGKQDGRTVIYSLANKKVENLLNMAEKLLELNAQGIYECTKM